VPRLNDDGTPDNRCPACEISDETDAEYNALVALTRIKQQNPAVGRNDPCPCGTGKKFKKCCGR
jgi:preprotein translocase subunit SecA